MQNKNKTIDIVELFSEKKYLKVCAPMVRYSKLQFRNLVRQYNCDLCFTPMILADSFCQSERARRNEFTTNRDDGPLVVQFAANSVHDFVGAAHMVSPYCDGVDLNCGCPQLWAKRQGLGCILLEKPEIIADMVNQCRNHIPKPFTVSVKIRISKDISKTVEICRQLEKAGVSFLTIHARTPTQLTGNINVNVLKAAVENVSCPVIANGGLKTIEDCEVLHQETQCKGVMVANAVLTNPELFSGANRTSEECVQKWVDTCYNSTLDWDSYDKLLHSDNYIPHIPEKPKNLTYQCFHHHLVFMLEKILSRKRRQIFNNLQTFADALKFLNDHLGIIPRLYDSNQFLRTCPININYSGKDSVYFSLKKSKFDEKGGDTFIYNCDDTEGNYFKSKVLNTNSDSEYDLNNLFSGD